MSFVATKAKFHVALDGIGLLLQGAPDRLAYKAEQAPVYNARFGEGDRSYTDFSFWWFFAQTDWSAGIKDTIAWEDDAKYFYSTNVDTFSEPGAAKLFRRPILDEDFAENIICGVTAEVAGTTYNFVGGTDDGSSRPHVYRAPSGTGQAWTDISTTNIDTNQNIVSRILGRNGRIWVLTVGVGATDVVNSYDGTTWRDNSGDIKADAALTNDPLSSRCGVEYQGTLYVFVDNTSNTQHALVKTTVADPNVSGSWSLVFEKTTVAGVPIACAGYNGKIIYLLNFTGYTELWEYDIAAVTNTLLRTFKGTNITNWGMDNKLIVELNGKLLITIPSNEIWELDGDALTRLYVRDAFKRDILGNLAETSAYLAQGCVISDNKAWWGNLMYDGEAFFNTFQNSTDDANVLVYPLFSDNSNRIWHTDSADTSILFVLDPVSDTFKGSADQNYIVFSNFDLVSGIDKIAYNITLGFKKFASGQGITIEYTTDELGAATAWTSLGTASFALDGASVTFKTFLFPVGTTFKKIWFRVKFTGGGTNTPTMTDFVMQYLPVPAYKQQWTLNFNLADEVKRLDGSLVETTGRELRSRLERAWWTKSTLDFQDLDYATTLLNGALNATDTTITVDNTYDFPEQGRVRIDDEEITYTSKTPTTFVGCTRGARDTRASAHSDDSVANNAYKVIITDITTNVPIALQDKDLEYAVGMQVREV